MTGFSSVGVVAALQEHAANPIPAHWYMIMSIVLFVFGVLIIITRRNVIYILMGVELILNAASLNFVAFGSYRSGELLVQGTVMGTFIVVLAAAEAVIALAIILNVFGLFQSVRPDDPNLLRE